MKTLTSSTWIVALGLAMQSSFAAAPKTGRGNLEDLTLIVTDTVNLAPVEAAAMRRIVSLWMRYSGVRVKWEWRDPTIAYVVVTTERAFRQAPELEILIAARKPAVYCRNQLVLGVTTIGTRRASLYLAEIQFLDRSVEIGVGNLMGLVAVHEIGHMLIGQSHTLCGAMAPKWGKAEVEHLMKLRVPFSDAQSKLIREEIRRMGLQLAQHRPATAKPEMLAEGVVESAGGENQKSVETSVTPPGAIEPRVAMPLTGKH
ncbi:MAG: hypothetical protein J0H49_19305 [Acidobacteria bacterium]|nr:hypothetical protein [Acidobacteriota bacterium]